MAILYSYGERSTFCNPDGKGFYEKPELELEIKPLNYYDDGDGFGYEFYVTMRYKGQKLININICNRKNKDFSVSSWYQKSITLIDAFEEAIETKKNVIWEADPDPDMIISIYPNRDYPYLDKEEEGMFTIIVSPNTEQYNTDDDLGCYGGYEGIAYIITASEEDFVKFVTELKDEFKMFEICEEFPFEEVKPMMQCKVCNHIKDEKYPILKVINNDFGWHFLCGTVANEEDDLFSNMQYDTFKNVFENDKSISQIARMGKHHIAERKDLNSEWVVKDLFPFKNVNPTNKCWACSHILCNNVQINKIIRNKTGWFFLCGCDDTEEKNLSSLQEITFADIFKKYPDVSSVGNMSDNYIAQRIKKSEPGFPYGGWSFSPIEDV